MRSILTAPSQQIVAQITRGIRSYQGCSAVERGVTGERLKKQIFSGTEEEVKDRMQQIATIDAFINPKEGRSNLHEAMAILATPIGGFYESEGEFDRYANQLREVLLATKVDLNKVFDREKEKSNSCLSRASFRITYSKEDLPY